MKAMNHTLPFPALDVLAGYGKECDQSERKERKVSNRLLRTISHDTRAGQFITQQGFICYVNRAFRGITGYRERDLLGTDPFDYIFPGDRDTVRASLLLLTRNRRPSPFQYRIVNRKGKVKWLLETVSLTMYRENHAVLHSLMDTTQRKLLESKIGQDKEMDKLKRDLIATVSHELRTPLFTIRGHTSMILDYSSKLNEEEKLAHVRSIETAATRLTKMVDQFLDMSRLESGLLKLGKTDADIYHLIRSATEESRIRSPGHVIRTKISRGLPTASIDIERIHQVLDNLLDNACKYSDDGTSIMISATRVNKQLVVSIIDHGMGIPPDKVEPVFDRLYRVTTSSNHEGLGLGLAVCRGLVEAHGGRIRLESRLGRGSKFTLTLPIE